MGIYVNHSSNTLEERSHMCKRMWKKGGILRTAEKEKIDEIAELFKNHLSIGEIRAKLNYSKNGTVAKYLRKAGFDIPYTSKKKVDFKQRSIDSFYEDIRI